MRSCRPCGLLPRTYRAYQNSLMSRENNSDTIIRNSLLSSEPTGHRKQQLCVLQSQEQWEILTFKMKKKWETRKSVLIEAVIDSPCWLPRIESVRSWPRMKCSALFAQARNHEAMQSTSTCKKTTYSQEKKGKFYCRVEGGSWNVWRDFNALKERSPKYNIKNLIMASDLVLFSKLDMIHTTCINPIPD